jgi:rhodanese-related sulfurtransferase
MYMEPGEADDSDDYLPSLLPTPDHLLVLLGHDEQQQAAAAAAKAAAAGFDRVAVLAGGVNSLHTGVDQGQLAVGMATPVQLTRDALALLLDLAPLPEELYQQLSESITLQQQQQQPGSPSLAGQGTAAAAAAAAAMGGAGGIGSEAAAAAAAPMLRGRRVLVLDVRRHDERTLYGSIPGALHLPGGNPWGSVYIYKISSI